MELTTVKSCFEKYASFLKSHENITVEAYDLNSMTIYDVDKMTQTLFTDYVINCESKVNHMSVPCTLYKHMHTLIRQHIQDEEKKTVSHLNDHIFQLEDTNTRLKKEIKVDTTISPTSKAGWFF